MTDNVSGDRPPPRARRWRARIAFYGSLALAAMGAAFAGAGEFAFYFPQRAASPTPLGAEEVWFESRDGTRLHGWFFRASGVEGANAPTVVFAHGNAGSLIDHLAFADFLPDAGFNLFAFDYRGYGRSERPSRWLRRADLIRDTEAAVAYVTSRTDADATRIGLYGYSLGGVLGLAASAENPSVRAVVAGGAFSGWRRIASEKLPIVGGWFVRAGSDAESTAAMLDDRPLLLIHAESDEIVPVSHARRIESASRAAGVDVALRSFPRGGHNDLLDQDAARRAIVDFFRSALR